MSGGDEFLLKWNDHHNSFFNIMQELCANEVSQSKIQPGSSSRFVVPDLCRIRNLNIIQLEF